MEAHLYAGPGNVVIDSCEECCMIWLDRGEAKRIASAADVRAPQFSSFSENYVPTPDQSWIGFRQPTIADVVVDDVSDSLFR